MPRSVPLPSPTTHWTDIHPHLLAGAALGSGYVFLAARAPQALGLGLLAVGFATILLASLGDAVWGLVAGLGGGIASLALHPLSGIDPAGRAGAAAGAVLLLLGLAGVTGDAAARVRRGRRLTARLADRAVAPAAGSLGLLSSADAVLRLQEEIFRARLHHRPLTTAVIRVDIDRAGCDPQTARQVRRAVARVLQTDLRLTDIPFAAADGEFGVILPETERGAAIDVVESVLIAARESTFADRPGGGRRRVGEIATVSVGLAQVHPEDPDETTPCAQLDRTRAGMVLLPEWPGA